MPYNSQITRTDAGPLIPEEVSREIVQGIAETSVALSLFRRVADMSRKQTRMPCLSALPTAYFVDGDTGLKQTSEAAWENKYLYAEEIACIVPIPEAVLDDADYDIWGEIKPRIVEAFGKVIDGAIFFGTNKPTLWPDGIVTAATAASNNLADGNGADLVDDLNSLMGLVEADGYEVTGFAAAPTFKSRLRGLRDANGGLLYQPGLTAGTPGSLYGEPLRYARNGAWNAGSAVLICGDMSQAIYSIRQDMAYKILTEAVITDNTGAIVYNLPQQDMVALRAVMRLAWQVPNPINSLQPVAASRYPFAVLTP